VSCDVDINQSASSMLM